MIHSHHHCKYKSVKKHNPLVIVIVVVVAAGDDLATNQPPPLGILHDTGGVMRISRIEDMKERLKENLNAFDEAILAHKERAPIEVPQCKSQHHLTSLHNVGAVCI